MAHNLETLTRHSFPESGEFFAVVSPLNNNSITSLPEISAEQLEGKIKAVSDAFPSWSARTAQERADVLQKWHGLILENKDVLVEIMHKESAKLKRECEAEVKYAAAFVDEYATQAVKPRGDELETGEVVYQSIGAVAAITPWNFPAAMITRKVSPALAAGCTVICKPAEKTPLTAIALLNLAREAGIGEGVFELVLGDAKMIGKKICASNDIKKLSFTGSTAVGKILMRQCADTVKKVTMELGGNAPFIVLKDADLDEAAEAAVQSRFKFSGQVCVSSNRFLVAQEVHDEFLQKVLAKVEELEIAPLISKDAAQNVESLVQGAVAEGANLICGSGKCDGNVFEPTILTGVTENMEIFATEIFGPVMTFVKFDSVERAIEMANNTHYGLAAFVYGGAANEVAKKLNFGMVGANSLAISNPKTPFGGMNQSGIGREGSHFGIEEYYEVKFIAK